MRTFDLLVLLSLATLISSSVFAEPSPKRAVNAIGKVTNKANSKPNPSIRSIKSKNYGLWDQIRRAHNLKFDPNHPRIIKERMRYLGTPKYLYQVTKRAEPFLFHIIESLKKEGLPVELALLPMIESAYRTDAISKSGAAGLWQFIPATGQHFGLERNQWYDGRQDIRASTQAAIKYLKKLHKLFNGDWLLVLAAYNAGENNILKAMDKNLRQGRPLDYWHLLLREETALYVPKFLAILSIFHYPGDYGVNLWPIKSRPFFTQVSINKQASLRKYAKKLNVNLNLLNQLNAGLQNQITPPKQRYQMLLPVAAATRFRSTAKEAGNSSKGSHHRVSPGETLTHISRQYDISVTQLKKDNQLDGDNIHPGQTLIIPGS
jgi:membrane-bound lytic murein transglycosylase D